MPFAAALLVSGTAVAQTAAPGPQRTGEGLAPSTPAVSAPSLSLSDTQNPFLGGVTSGQVTPGVMRLTLQDAIGRGLKYNLGLYLSGQGTAQARAARLRALSGLLPTLNAHVAETAQQINLAAIGFPMAAASKFGISTIAGPFAVFDARGAVAESLSLASWNNYRASLANVDTATLNYQDARDLVVLVSGGLYMQALAGAARIQAVQTQFTTAQALYNQAVDLKKAGVTPGIDVLRAQVEFQVQQQRLVAAKNDFEKEKLQLARAIGLPVGQQFELSEQQMPSSPSPAITFEQALDRAYKNRADYRAAKTQVRSAELLRKAAVGERIPSIQFSGDYGILGNTPGNSHGTFTASGALVIPIFEGGRIKSDIQQADALLNQRKAQADDTRNRVEYEIRSAFLDLNSAAQQVEVARSSVGLAQEQVRQAQDRFSAGVTNNIEVIQAQEALATTNDNYINSLLAHNLAKLSLARALGVAEQAAKEFLGGTQ
ncbi:MAG TPA: TolC family protein [Terriglobales bacterium]|nr:TolC family protein [Terriglobales bacterium]